MAKNFTVKYKRIRGPLPKEINKQVTDYQLYEANRRQRKAARYLLNEVIKASSVTTFTLAQLKDRDHPYATKHGKIRNISPLKSYNVHTRDGKFIKGFKITSKDLTLRSKGYARVNYDKRHARRKDYYYGQAIFEGTKKMLPRNPIAGVYSDPTFAKNLRTILEGTRAASRGFKI